MQKIISVVVLASFVCLMPIHGYAGWTGPSEVLSEAWGTADNQLGFKPEDTADSFPEGFWLLGNKIVIRDQENRRIKIYDINGTREKIVNWIKQPNGSFKIPEYPLAGESVGYVKENLYTYYSPQKDYGAYSPTGQLIKTSAERPLELGVVKEEVLDAGKYKTTVTYHDHNYVLIKDKQYKTFIRDGDNNIYGILPGLVDKFTPCGKLLGRLILPEKTVFWETPVPTDREQYFMIHDEYGSPVVDVHGNVYTWKRTPAKYSILKWTWVDDPNVPTGPDAPSGLAVTPSFNGLYLTWTASPQDPGCVTKYEIARATTSGGVFSTVATVDKGVVKYNDTTAEAGTTYYYKVRAKAGAEYSPYTAEVSGKR